MSEEHARTKTLPDNLSREQFYKAQIYSNTLKDQIKIIDEFKKYFSEDFKDLNTSVIKEKLENNEYTMMTPNELDSMVKGPKKCSSRNIALRCIWHSFTTRDSVHGLSLIHI